MSFVGLFLYVVEMLGMWQMYKKMGRQGWEAIIPFYNLYVLYDVLYGSGMRFLTLFIPFYNIYVFIRTMIDLANAFNQSSGFAVGLIFLNTIFTCILGYDENIHFGDALEYENDFVDNMIERVSDKFNEFTEPESEEVSELKKLKVLREQELISEEEYSEKRKEVISRL